MINDFLLIPIVGAALSGIIQFLKTKYGTDAVTTKVGTIILATAVGIIYTIFQGTEYWATILGILASASTVYAFFLK